MPALPAVPRGAEKTTSSAKNISVVISPADDVSGSALRLLHAMGVAPSAGESLARCSPPAVPVLVGAIHWGGTAAVLAAETLKRGLSPSNRNRDLLVGAAVGAGLVQMLLQRLDWRSTVKINSLSLAREGDSGGEVASSVSVAVSGDEASDEAVQRVLFVDVLNLLALEGTYAAQVRHILDNSEIWAAYRGQQHDLFLPAGGTASQGVVGLLKGSETAKFALPAPPLPPSSSSAAVATEETVIIPEPPLSSFSAAAEDEVVVSDVVEPVFVLPPSSSPLGVDDKCSISSLAAIPLAAGVAVTRGCTVDSGIK